MIRAQISSKGLLVDNCVVFEGVVVAVVDSVFVLQFLLLLLLVVMIKNLKLKVEGLGGEMFLLFSLEHCNQRDQFAYPIICYPLQCVVYHAINSMDCLLEKLRFPKRAQCFVYLLLYQKSIIVNKYCPPAILFRVVKFRLHLFENYSHMSVRLLVEREGVGAPR